MPAKPSSSEIPLPRGWPSCVKTAILQVISLAQFALAYTRGWAANSPNSRIRLRAELDRALQLIALLREQLAIHKLRMAQLPPHRRPYYRPTERMSILQLKAACGWSLTQTAQEFLITADTIRSWLKRVDEEGPNALVQLREPVNKFPAFVRYLVQQLKALCPTLGKVKIAQILARAWILDDLAALLAPSVLAFRMVDCRDHGPLLPADHGHHPLPARADFSGGACLPRSRDLHGRSKAQTSGF